MICGTNLLVDNVLTRVFHILKTGRRLLLQLRDYKGMHPETLSRWRLT